MNTRCECLPTFLLTIILSLTVGCGSGGDGEKAGVDEKTSSAADGGSAEADSLVRNSSADSQRAKAEPKVAIVTSLGTITVRLNPKKAVLTVQNFLQYVDDKHYDETIFHDVSKDYAVLGGGYTKDMKQKKEQERIRNEAHNGLKNVRGTIAMVRKPDVIDSSTCQFMFNLADNDFLDHKDASTAEGYGYCVFGKVVDGMDILDKIGAQPVKEVAVPDGPPFQRVPVETVMIRSIRRIR